MVTKEDFSAHYGDKGRYFCALWRKKQTSRVLWQQKQNKLRTMKTKLNFPAYYDEKLSFLSPITPPNPPPSTQTHIEVEILLCLLFKSVFIHLCPLKRRPLFRAANKRKRKVKCNKFFILPRTPLHYAPLRWRNDGALFAFISSFVLSRTSKKNFFSR